MSKVEIATYVVMTDAAPVQISGVLTNGKHFYARARFGTATFGIAETHSVAVALASNLGDTRLGHRGLSYFGLPHNIDGREYLHGLHSSTPKKLLKWFKAQLALCEFE